MYPGSIIMIVAALSYGGAARLAAEDVPRVPPVDEVQRHAISHANLSPDDITSWKKRVRVAALLPKFQIDYGHRRQYDVDVDTNDSVYVGSSGVVVGPEDGGYSHNQNFNHTIGFKAIWNLDEAVFNANELNISAESRRLAGERQSMLAEVNRNYFERERLLGEIKHMKELKSRRMDGRTKHEIFVKEVAIREAGAALDALTGGWFSQESRRLSRRR
jgi:hypothetical protein